MRLNIFDLNWYFKKLQIFQLQKALPSIINIVKNNAKDKTVTENFNHVNNLTKSNVNFPKCN